MSGKYKAPLTFEDYCIRALISIAVIGVLYLLAKGIYAIWVKLMLNKDSSLNVFPKPMHDMK